MIRRWLWSWMENIFTRRLTQVEGLGHVPVNQAFLVAANHVDWLDGILLIAALDKKIPRVPIRYLARTNSYWLLGPYTIKIHPEKPEEAMSSAQRHIEKNGVIGFFPEGRRNADPQLLKGKTGCVRMAMKTGLPILPIGIQTPAHQSFVAAVFNIGTILRQSVIRIGEAYQLPQLQEKDLEYAILQQHTQELMKRIAQLSNKKEPDYATHP